MSELLKPDQLYEQLFGGSDVALIARTPRGWTARDVQTGDTKFFVNESLVNPQTLPASLLASRRLSGESRGDAEKLIAVVEAHITRSQTENTFYSAETRKIALVTDQLQYEKMKGSNQQALPFFPGSKIIPEIAQLMRMHYPMKKLVIILDIVQL